MAAPFLLPIQPSTLPISFLLIIETQVQGVRLNHTIFAREECQLV
jgi:hypothetical protein